MIAPDATVTLDFALHRMTNIIENLVVYPEAMMRNLEITRGLPFSQGILLRLIRGGLSRQDAYKRVQVVAMRAFEGGADFRELARTSTEITEHLTAKDLDEAFDLDAVLGRISDIFERVFEQKETP